MNQVGLDFPDYCAQFEAIYEATLMAAFGGPIEWATLKGTATGYLPEDLADAATAGYEVEVSPPEAVASMVILHAYAFDENHGYISRILRPSMRERMRDHDSMLAAVSPLVSRGDPSKTTATVREILQVFAERNVPSAHTPSHQQPLLNAFAERINDYIAKDPKRRP